MFLNILEDVLNFFRNKIIYISLVLMVLCSIPAICMLIGYNIFPNIIQQPDRTAMVLFSISTAIFTSSLFGAITQSNYFIGLYNKLITKEIKNTMDEKLETFYSDKKFLTGLSLDKQKSIWDSISNTILQNSFPKINDKIKAYVFDTYFPKDNTFYYSDYQTLLHYTVDKKDPKCIHVVEERNYVLIPSRNSKCILHKNSTIMAKTQFADYKIETLEINGETYNNVKDIITDCNVLDPFDDEGQPSIKGYYNIEKTITTEEERITIRCVIKRSFLLTQKTKLLRVSFRKFVQDIRVTIHYSDELSIEFFETGLLDEFKNKGITEGIINKEYKGIVFPGQGFIVSLDLK